MCILVAKIHLLHCQYNRSAGCGKKTVETHTNTAYGVVTRRDEDHTYDVVGQPKSGHNTATSGL